MGTWLEMLIATQGEKLLRVKGILNLAGQERPVAIHGVQHLFHPPSRCCPAGPTGDPRTSRLVMILRDLDPGRGRSVACALSRPRRIRPTSVPMHGRRAEPKP